MITLFIVMGAAALFVIGMLLYTRWEMTTPKSQWGFERAKPVRR